MDDQDNQERIDPQLNYDEKQNYYDRENLKIQIINNQSQWDSRNEVIDNLTFALEQRIENEDLEIVGIKELS